MSTTARQGAASRPEWMDDEQWALSRNPRFKALLEEGKKGPFFSAEESRRRAGITDEEWAAANAELDRILAEEAEQEAEEERRNGAAPGGRTSSPTE